MRDSVSRASISRVIKGHMILLQCLIFITVDLWLRFTGLQMTKGPCKTPGVALFRRSNYQHAHA